MSRVNAIALGLTLGFFFSLQGYATAADYKVDKSRSARPLTCTRGATCYKNCRPFGNTQRCRQFYCDGAAWQNNGTCLTDLDCPPNQCPE